MIRRKTQKTKNSGNSWLGAENFSQTSRNKKTTNGKNISKSEVRFGISMVILITLLMVSAYLLVLVIFQTSRPVSVRNGGAPYPINISGANLDQALTENQKLDDPNLDFKLTVPGSFGYWFYRIGNVQSPVDDTLSDQFVKIYLPLDKFPIKSNMDEQFFNILTMMKFSKVEWQKIEKSCQKDQTSTVCARGGTKISENNDSVYAYSQAGNCPPQVQRACATAYATVNSFQLK